MEEKYNGQNEENLSMEDILKQMDEVDERRGRSKTAEVHSIQPDGLLVILEGKLDGFAPESELVKPLKEYNIGDKIEVQIMKVDEDEGRSIVSEKRIYFRTSLKKVEAAHKNGEPVTGTILGETKGGYNVRLLNVIPAFLPGSQSGIRRGKPIPEGEQEFKVISFRKKKRGANIVVSLTAFKEEKVKAFFETLEVGSTIEGTIESIKDFGAFVKLTNEVVGLIPASEVSWDPSQKIHDVLKAGDKVTAKIIGVDPKKKKISLSLKQLQEDPWNTVEEKYPVGSVIDGVVKSIVPFGFFVMLEPGVEGLVHISEVFWGNVRRDLKELIKEGDRVKVKVKDIDKEKRTLSLSYREALGDPWDNIEEKYKAGEIVKGKIVKVLPTGAIVELEEYVSGFVPVSEMSWNFVDRVEDVVKETSEVKAKILSIDKENRRMRLSLKQATDDPWLKVHDELKVGDYVEGKITRLIKSGAIVMIDGYGVEAFLPASQVAMKRVENLDDAIKIGEHRRFKIIRLVYDPEKDVRNMVVSIKQLLLDKEKEETQKALEELSGEESSTLSLGERLKEHLEKNSEGEK